MSALTAVALLVLAAIALVVVGAVTRLVLVLGSQRLLGRLSRWSAIVEGILLPFRPTLVVR